jgi:hypothetical protein
MKTLIALLVLSVLATACATTAGKPPAYVHPQCSNDNDCGFPASCINGTCI